MLMKISKPFVAAAAIGALSTVFCAKAQDSTTTSTTTTTTTSDQGSMAPSSAFYRAQELSFDLFGSGSIGQETINHVSGARLRDDGRLGAGGGLNFFFCRYLGVGGDAYSENTAHNFINSASANLIGRLPIGDTGIAPYIFGGGGRQFEEVLQSFGQAGGGIEFRFAKHVGFFVDARYVFADKTDNYGVGRAGLRISF